MDTTNEQYINRQDLKTPTKKLSAQVAHDVMRINLSFAGAIKNFSDFSCESENLPICMVYYVKKWSQTSSFRRENQTNYYSIRHAAKR